MLHPRVSTTAASAPKVCGHHSTLPFAQRTHSLCLALPQSLDQCNTSCVILRYQTFPAWGTQQNRLLCLQPAIAPERGERPSSLVPRKPGKRRSPRQAGSGSAPRAARTPAGPLRVHVRGARRDGAASKVKRVQPDPGLHKLSANLRPPAARPGLRGEFALAEVNAVRAGQGSGEEQAVTPRGGRRESGAGDRPRRQPLPPEGGRKKSRRSSPRRGPRRRRLSRGATRRRAAPPATAGGVPTAAPGSPSRPSPGRPLLSRAGEGALPAAGTGSPAAELPRAPAALPVRERTGGVPRLRGTPTPGSHSPVRRSAPSPPPPRPPG